MSKKTPPPSEVLSVPFRSIHIPENQIRSDEPEIPSLAASLEEKGQMIPLLVVRGGPEGKDYTLVEGFRRCAAWVLNGWQDKREILVSVREQSDPLSRIVDNWTANMEREGFHPLDQAECISNLLTGGYDVLEGEVAVSVEKDVIAKRLNMSATQVGRLARLHKVIDADVAHLARKAEAPLYLLTEISRVEGEGGTSDAKAEDRAIKQNKMLTDWIRKQELLAASGRKRSERGTGAKGGKGKGRDEDDSPSGVVRLTRRVAHASYTDARDRGYTVGDYYTVLKVKQSALEADRAKESREAAIRVKGILDGIRFLSGEIKKLPDLNKSDFDVLKPEPEEVVEESAE